MFSVLVVDLAIRKLMPQIIVQFVFVFFFAKVESGGIGRDCKSKTSAPLVRGAFCLAVAAPGKAKGQTCPPVGSDLMGKRQSNREFSLIFNSRPCAEQVSGSQGVKPPRLPAGRHRFRSALLVNPLGLDKQ